MSHDIRWIQRFSNYKKAFSQLNEGVLLSEQRALSNLEKQGLIQAFEYTHELAWKIMKNFLEYRGVTEQIYGSRDATRQAFSYNIIENGDTWMHMIKSRNLTSHTYDEDTVEEIIDLILGSYILEFEAFYIKFEELEKEELKAL